MKITKLITLLATLSFVGSAPCGTVNWGSAFGSSNVQSDGSTALDSGFTFQLGKFTDGFTPTEANADVWAANWVVFDTIPGSSYNAPFGYFTSEAQLLDNSVFHAGDQAFVWVYNSQSPVPGTEWLLYTNDSTDGNAADDWTFFSVPGSQQNLELSWRVSNASHAVFGSLDPDAGGGTPPSIGGGVGTPPATPYSIQTYTFVAVPEPAAALLLLLGAGSLALTQAQRRRTRGATAGGRVTGVKGKALRSKSLAGGIALASVLAPSLHAQMPEWWGKAGATVTTCRADLDSDHVMMIMDTRNKTVAPLALDWAPTFYAGASWTRANLGQVYGIALDGQNNIYVTATMVYGMPNAYNSTQLVGVYGPGGSGAVYKINASTGAITTFCVIPQDQTVMAYDTTGLTGSSTFAAAIVDKNGTRVGAGLGNICYDADHAQFFVTSFDDGKIHRISGSGTILDSFDPKTLDQFVADASPTDTGNNDIIAPLGDRVWGVGYYGGRVYFSAWKEDRRPDNPASSSTIFNAVYSVALTSRERSAAPNVSSLTCQILPRTAAAPASPPIQWRT